MQMTKAQQDRFDNLHERILEEYLEKAKGNLAFAKDRKQKAIKNNIPNHLLIRSINTVLHWEWVIEKTEELLARHGGKIKKERKMQYRKTTMNRVNMLRNTERSKDSVAHYIDTAQKLTTDPEREQRKKRHLCTSCYYIQRVSGSAVSSRPCMGCSVVIQHGSTNVPELCLDCAKKYELCRQCGGDIKLRVRRSKWPEGSEK